MLGKDTIVQSERVSGLQVRAYESGSFIELPPAYTRDYIPVNRDHIPTREIAKKWSHLCQILQIRYTTIKRLWNWSINMLQLSQVDGSLIGDCWKRWTLCCVNWFGMEYCRVFIFTSWFAWRKQSHRLAAKELPPVTPTDMIRVFETDFKDINEERMKVSQDDIPFLKKNEGKHL